ncbi:hypothetical protein RRG08_054064 [Elysia crispata]|uniref:Uncharacterized protein n=1 Tax=Elysia crispata TaxID=231223 RepID=A0AAE0ZDP7_9GAST|nr:hypothetical protein RRG08_054064 [Elysia crispata]
MYTAASLVMPLFPWQPGREVPANNRKSGKGPRLIKYQRIILNVVDLTQCRCRAPGRSSEVRPYAHPVTVQAWADQLLPRLWLLTPLLVTTVSTGVEVKFGSLHPLHTGIKATQNKDATALYALTLGILIKQYNSLWVQLQGGVEVGTGMRLNEISRRCCKEF